MSEKLYLNNPYMRKATATVLDKTFENEKYFIKLDKTIFYPHRTGGEVGDIGTIDDKEVIEVYEDDSEIIHVLKEDLINKNVDLKIDWENRFDIMQQHTGQHILSATFEKLFNAKTIGFYMGENYITIDIELSDISEQDITRAEILSNKIIQSDFKVINEFLNPDNINHIDMTELPKDVKDNKEIRIINVNDVSRTLCCGTHLSSTGEVGLIKIINTEKHRDNIRISFLCGNRALKDYTLKHYTINEIALSLSTAIEDVFEGFIKLKEENEVLHQENIDLKKDFLSSNSEKLLSKKKNINKIDYIVEDSKDIKKNELNHISSSLNKNNNLIQIYKLEGEDNSEFIISRSHDLDINLKEVFHKVSKEITIKGGGDEEKIQGTTSTASIDKVNEIFFKEIQDYFNY